MIRSGSRVMRGNLRNNSQMRTFRAMGPILPRPCIQAGDTQTLCLLLVPDVPVAPLKKTTSRNTLFRPAARERTTEFTEP